MSESD